MKILLLHAWHVALMNARRCCEQQKQILCET